MKRLSDITRNRVATLSEAMRLVEEDGGLTDRRKSQLLSSLRGIDRWSETLHGNAVRLVPTQLPFTSVSVEDTFAKLVPAVVGVTRKRLQNALADCRYVLERYGLSRKRVRITHTPAVHAFERKLRTFERIAMGPLLNFLSLHEIDPRSMSDEISARYGAWLQRIGLKNADATYKRTITVWNRTDVDPTWPKIILSVPNRRVIWGLPWRHFPSTLQMEIDAFFARRNCPDIFSEAAAHPLKPISIVGQKEMLRFAASALVRSGVPPENVAGLRDLCMLDRFKRALEWLAHKRGGANKTVGNVALVLVKLAKHAGVLTSAQTNEVLEAHKRVRSAVKHHERDRDDRDQKLLDQLDDPKIVDALLELPSRTVRRVLASGRRTRREAVAVQLALILEIWLCAPLRLKNIRHLRLDQHFFRASFNGSEHTVVRIPAADVKNGKPLEHILNPDTVDLLTLYVDTFLPILTRNNPSPYLFPGWGGQPKAPQVFRSQTKKFVREGTGLDFHPHVIRKITTKLYLDQDPGGIEVARRNLGDTEETTRSVYAQRVHRASNRKFVDALESRRLTAFSPVRLKRSPKG